MSILIGGPTPLDGASAYEIAVANGFVGSEAAWLASLVGPPGQPGQPGPPGQPGQPGQPAPNQNWGVLILEDNTSSGDVTYQHQSSSIPMFLFCSVLFIAAQNDSAHYSATFYGEGDLVLADNVYICGLGNLVNNGPVNSVWSGMVPFPNGCKKIKFKKNGSVSSVHFKKLFIVQRGGNYS